MKRIVCLLLLVLFLIAPAAALSQTDGEARTLLSSAILAELRGNGPGTELLRDAASLYPVFPRKINDSAGREVVLFRPPERIVVMNSDAADGVSILGMADNVVGVGDAVVNSPLRFPDLAALPNVGKYNEPNIEAILAVNPDMVITYVSWPEPEKLDRHLPGRIAVVRMDLYLAETFREELKRLNYLFGEKKEADEYFSWYDGIHALVSERVVDILPDERARVFVDYGEGKSIGRRTMSEGTGMHDLLVAAGGVNVAAGHVTGYADVENEWVIRENPDVIMIWSAKGGYKLGESDVLRDARDNVISQPGFNRIAAVSGDRVYAVTSAFGFGSSSPAALVRVASWLYPDRFADIDPDEIHREYLERFTHTGESVRKEGAFYYPVR